jgi:hypothetical protein
VGQVLPADVEICDGVDNDCDDTVGCTGGDCGIDEGNPGGGLVCRVSGADGICALGQTLCQDGEVTCVQTTFPDPAGESCNGLDDDCDGDTDENATDTGAMTRDCYSGDPTELDHPPCAAGTQVCQAGGWSTCEGQVLPSTESCDGTDNDCDGEPDDGDPGGGAACNTGLLGICSAGTLHCDAAQGKLVCEQDEAAAADDDTCDGINDDCDEFVDEDVPDLGDTCSVGLGECRRTGVYVCVEGNAGAPPFCETGDPIEGTDEVCDYADNDCDGHVDEDFREGTDGPYNVPTDCGACGIDCNNEWPGGPEEYNVEPTCDPTTGCGFDCTGTALNLDDIEENGCEYVPDPEALFVARPINGGDDTDTCGAIGSPCATIGHAILRAASLGRPRVRVSSGVYAENVRLVNGVSLLGGHNAQTWERNPEVNVSLIRGTTVRRSTGCVAAGGSCELAVDCCSGRCSGHEPVCVDSPDRVAVEAIGVTEPTELSGFTIEGENAGPGIGPPEPQPAGNSVAIYVADSSSALEISDNVVLAGRGGDGVRGTPGEAGLAGADGESGNDRGGRGERTAGVHRSRCRVDHRRRRGQRRHHTLPHRGQPARTGRRRARARPRSRRRERRRHPRRHRYPGTLSDRHQLHRPHRLPTR